MRSQSITEDIVGLGPKGQENMFNIFQPAGQAMQQGLSEPALGHVLATAPQRVNDAVYLLKIRLQGGVSPPLYVVQIILQLGNVDL